MQARNPENARGVDVSHWQGAVDWAKVSASGIKFAILKATEGTQFIDDTLAVNVLGARENGISVGVYHFCRAATITAAIAEAKFFCSVIDDLGGIKMFDIPPVLDIESANAPKAELTAICLTFLQTIEQRYGVRPMIYTYPNFLDNYLGEGLSDYPLWYAYYSDTPISDKKGWTEWTIVQHTDKGVVPGIAGNVDMNEYNGSVIKLAKTYTDVAGHWANKAIVAVTEAGIMEGYEDGKFQPEKTVTRAELATVLNHLLFQINNK